MAPTMIGAQTAAAAIAKITAIIAHDHQSLLPDRASDSGTARLLALDFARRAFGMVDLLIGSRGSWRIAPIKA
jgi:hypothetical protein